MLAQAPYQTAVQEYLKKIEANLRAGNATEHTHRAALAELIEALEPGITATNEPKRSSVGAPDYIVSRDGAGLALPVGYIEAKDVGDTLPKTEKTDQLKRYRQSLPNLILTDYLQFRWYLDGEIQQTASLGTADRQGRIALDAAGSEAVRALLGAFLAQAPPQLGNPRELA